MHVVYNKHVSPKYIVSLVSENNSLNLESLSSFDALFLTFKWIVLSLSHINPSWM